MVERRNPGEDFERVVFTERRDIAGGGMLERFVSAKVTKLLAF